MRAPRYILCETTGCHLAIGEAVGPYGYIRVRRDGKNVKAHRLAWSIAKGPIPPGLFVLHKCDNPPCCNIDHLFLGTARDNADDMLRKKRSRYGELSRTAKLTEKQVKDILLSDEMGTTMAAKYGVSSSQIAKIRTGRNWGHIKV